MAARWPMVVFFSILGVSAYKAFVVWMEVNPGWKQGKFLKRRLSLEELGKAVVAPLIQRRQHPPRTPSSAGLVENFRQSLYHEAENLFSNHIPLKIARLDGLLKEDALSITNMSSLHAPLDIPIPDPPTPEEEEMETDKNEEDEKKKKKAPKCGFIKGNEKIVKLLDEVKPEIVALRETIITVACWIQHLIPKIEDGNDFGVAIQEKILERIAAVKTKVEGFQTNINKYFSERGDAVAKASKETHVMDYRSLVHDKDESIYSEIRVIVLDIRGFYAELYDIISKNLEKVTNPKGEEKPSMY